MKVNKSVSMELDIWQFIEDFMKKKKLDNISASLEEIVRTIKNQKTE